MAVKIGSRLEKYSLGAGGLKLNCRWSCAGAAALDRSRPSAGQTKSVSKPAKGD